MDAVDHQQPVIAGDTPSHRITVAEMTDEQLTKWVAGIRHRRMAMQREYELAVLAKDAVKRDKDKEELAHQVKMLTKEFESIDKTLTKVEARVQKVRAIRILAERFV